MRWLFNQVVLKYLNILSVNMDIQQWFSTGGDLVPWDIWQCLEMFLIIMTREVLLASSG